MKPEILTEDQLPTDVDAALTHWSLGLLLRGHRSLHEARFTELRARPLVRSAFERAADRSAK